jgi:hypothetical protein
MLAGKRTKRLLRPRHRLEDGIRVNLKEIGTNTANFVDTTQERDCWRALVNATLNLRVP